MRTPGVCYKKVAKITMLRSSCRGAYCVQRWYDGSFQTRPATQRLAKEAQRHCKHPLCGGAVRTGCPPYVA